MKIMMVRRYTTAHTAPIVSGLKTGVNLDRWKGFGRKSQPTYISFFLDLDMSLPLRPALMKVSPSHRIKLKANAKDIPLNAKEAIRGSPSPWKVLTITPRQAAERVRRLHASEPVSVVVMPTRWPN